MKVIFLLNNNQYEVKYFNYCYVDKISNYKIGDIIVVKDILLLVDKLNNDMIIGNPVIKNMFVKFIIIDIFKNKKVIVFKKKRRKGYKVKRGSREILMKIKFINISYYKYI